MPKLIVTSRYLKSGTSKNLANYVKYIATREGSVAVQENNGIVPATKQQQKLISTLLRDFPDSKDIFEYEEYIKANTQKTASSLISEIIDRNADRLETRETYISYLANRPGAVKLDAHALFSQEETPIDLNAVAKEIANHSGNVWTHVVSLRRDSAQQMGYDNLQAWRDLIKRQIPNIAKNQKMLKKLKLEIKLINDNIDKMYVDKLNGEISEQIFERVLKKLTEDSKQKEREYEEIKE